MALIGRILLFTLLCICCATNAATYFIEPEQWNLLGPGEGEPFGANVFEAWKLLSESASPGIVVGIISPYGCQKHPDVKYCPSDDPECGGYDFGDDDDDPLVDADADLGEDPENDNGLHGLYVARMLQSMCPTCRLMCLKTVDTITGGPSKKGTWHVQHFAQPVDYMIRKKVKLSNYSYGAITGHHDSDYQAIQRLQKAGHLFVSEAGEPSYALDNIWPRLGYYPGAFDLDNIIVVGSSDRDGAKTRYSNWGRTKVDIFAPGGMIPVDIYVSKGWFWDTRHVLRETGPKFACVHATATAALVWEQYPDLSYAEVKKIIMSTSTPVEALKGLCQTGGIVDAHAAVGSKSAAAGFDTCQTCTRSTHKWCEQGATGICIPRSTDCPVGSPEVTKENYAACFKDCPSCLGGANIDQFWWCDLGGPPGKCIPKNTACGDAGARVATVPASCRSVQQRTCPDCVARWGENGVWCVKDGKGRCTAYSRPDSCLSGEDPIHNTDKCEAAKFGTCQTCTKNNFKWCKKGVTGNGSDRCIPRSNACAGTETEVTALSRVVC